MGPLLRVPLLLMRHPPLSSLRVSPDLRLPRNPRLTFLLKYFVTDMKKTPPSHSLDRQEMILDGVQATRVTNVWTSVDGEREENGPSYRETTLRLPHNLCHSSGSVVVISEDETGVRRLFGCS